MKPNDAWTWTMKGYVEAISGRPRESRESYQRSLQLVPGSAQAHLGIGIADRKLGNRKEAVDHLRQAMRLTTSPTIRDRAEEELNGLK